MHQRTSASTCLTILTNLSERLIGDAYYTYGNRAAYLLLKVGHVHVISTKTDIFRGS